MSATIADNYAEVDQYLGDGGSKGTLMCGLALIAWYCTVAKEVNATISSYFVTRSIPIGSSTQIIKEKEGRYFIVMLSWQRLCIRMGVSIVRIVLAVFMFIQGTQFLVYTISLEDLLLNAVALEFVISTDELLFHSLAPARAKRVLSNTEGFKLEPAKTWNGMDRRSFFTNLAVCTALVWAAADFMQPQLTVLHRVRHAICAGDLSFVYSIDGVGTVAWGYPASQSTLLGAPTQAINSR